MTSFTAKELKVVDLGDESTLDIDEKDLMEQEEQTDDSAIQNIDSDEADRL